MLLEHGADIHKKTLKGNSCLWLAVESNYKDTVKLLLKKGAKINEKGWMDQTELFRAQSRMVIHILLENGADVNVVDEFGDSPLKVIPHTDRKHMIIKELAKLKFDNQKIHPKILEHLAENSNLKFFFDCCLEELLSMKDFEFFEGLSLSDILMLKNQPKKLALIAKNEDFISTFDFSKYFITYGRDLCRILKKAEDIRDAVEIEEEKIYESGLDKKFFLPPEIMDIIVEFATDHLYYQRTWKSEKAESDSDSEFKYDDNSSDEW